MTTTTCLVRPSYSFARVLGWTAEAGVDLTDLSTWMAPLHVSGNYWEFVSLSFHGSYVVYNDLAKALSHERVQLCATCAAGYMTR